MSSGKIVRDANSAIDKVPDSKFSIESRRLKRILIPKSK
jgi:hypothetical protein